MTGGSIELSFVKEYIKKEAFDRVIAVDSGLEVVDKLGIYPDYILGDFDSVSMEVLKKYEAMEEEWGIRFIRLSTEKDMSDTHEALRLAIDEYAEDIVVLGATGSRIDHVLANVNVLIVPLSFGVEACLLDAHNKIYLTDHNIVLKKDEVYGPYVSLLPLTEECCALFLRGFKYNLNNATLTIGDSIGISNEIVEDIALLEMGEGVLVVIESRD